MRVVHNVVEIPECMAQNKRCAYCGAQYPELLVTLVTTDKSHETREFCCGNCFEIYAGTEEENNEDW